jgi:hypothetical protein
MIATGDDERATPTVACAVAAVIAMPLVVPALFRIA